ncbi:MAG: hypothetical protein RIB45_02205 [Marivibrio sp.]|uniref:HMA2 domain-containing protein n=1 Tax=Marivibrio sp. TaxID=2039719 RepID=UPI0032EE1E2A
MTDYHHHVPGRLRVRRAGFRHEGAARRFVLRRLRALHGVRDVRLNPKAASVTVAYDAEQTDAAHILAFIDREFALKPAPAGPGAAPVPAVRRARPRRAPALGADPLIGQIGKMALSVLVNKGVSYSISSLLGARS